METFSSKPSQAESEKLLTLFLRLRCTFDGKTHGSSSMVAILLVGVDWLIMESVNGGITSQVLRVGMLTASVWMGPPLSSLSV